MNHHGPLEINSGGSCGGPSMANNILRVMQNQSQPGVPGELENIGKYPFGFVL